MQPFSISGTAGTSSAPSGFACSGFGGISGAVANPPSASLASPPPPVCWNGPLSSKLHTAPPPRSSSTSTASSARVADSSLSYPLQAVVQRLSQVYFSVLQQRIRCVSSLSAGSAAETDSWPSAFDVSEAYRGAVLSLAEEKATSFWGLVSYLLCFWEEQQGHSTGTPLRSLNISPTLHRWYREHVVQFPIVLEQLNAFDPAGAASSLFAAAASPQDAGMEREAAAIHSDRLVFLIESITHLVYCGALELAAMLFEKVLQCFRCHDGLVEETQGAQRQVNESLKVFLSPELESCLAAVKQLLLTPVKSPSGDPLRLPSVDPPQESSESRYPQDPIGHGNGVAYFSSPLEHQQWRREANSLVFTAKRLIGDWIQELGVEISADAIARSTATYFFHQFALMTLDLLLIISGDAVLLEEVAVESSMSLMSFLVGLTTLCEPFTTTHEFAVLLEKSLQSPTWREKIRITKTWNPGTDDEPPSRTAGEQCNHGWQYFLLHRLLRCEDVSEIPAALRKGLEEDVEATRCWGWNPSAMHVTSEDYSDSDTESTAEDVDEECGGTETELFLRCSPEGQESIQRFIVTAMCFFLADLTALPPSLFHSGVAAPPPENLVHRYVLLDSYLDLLAATQPAGAVAESALPSWLWPVRLTLLLSSPLHNPQTMRNEVRRVTANLIATSGTTPRGRADLDVLAYQRLMGFLCGAGEVPPGIAVRVGNTFHTSGQTAGMINWHPQSTVKRYIACVLRFFATGSWTSLPEAAAAGGWNDEEDADEDEALEDGSHLSTANYFRRFYGISVRWEELSERHRQETLREMHIILSNGVLSQLPPHDDADEEAIHLGISTFETHDLTARFTSAPLSLSTWLSRQYTFIATQGHHVVANPDKSLVALPRRMNEHLRGSVCPQRVSYSTSLRGSSPMSNLIAVLRLYLQTPDLLDRHVVMLQQLGNAVQHQFVRCGPITVPSRSRCATPTVDEQEDLLLATLLEVVAGFGAVAAAASVAEYSLENQQRLVDAVCDLFAWWSHRRTPSMLPSLHPRVRYQLLERAVDALLRMQESKVLSCKGDRYSVEYIPLLCEAFQSVKLSLPTFSLHSGARGAAASGGKSLSGLTSEEIVLRCLSTSAAMPHWHSDVSDIAKTRSTETRIQNKLLKLMSE